MLYHTHKGCHCFPPCLTSRSKQLDFVSVLFYFEPLRWTNLLYLPHHIFEMFFKDGGRWSLKSSFLILMSGCVSLSDSRRDFWIHCHVLMSIKDWVCYQHWMYRTLHLCCTLKYSYTTFVSRCYFKSQLMVVLETLQGCCKLQWLQDSLLDRDYRSAHYYLINTQQQPFFLTVPFSLH